MASDNVKLEFVKQEHPDVFYDYKTHDRFNNMVGMEGCCGLEDMAGHTDTGSRVTENKITLAHPEQKSLDDSRIVNSYITSLKHEECDQISESVSSMNDINTKLRRVANKTSESQIIETPVKCTQISEKSLDYHDSFISCIHQRIKQEATTYMSDVCDPNTGADLYFNRKMRTHTAEKPNTCDDCGASFTRASTLMRHKRTHTGERPYKCDDCGACFTRSEYLKVHKRTHTGEKPYTCDYYNTSFTRAEHLNVHKRTHTGEKPYTCDDCGASILHARNLKLHMRIHTGEKTY